MPPLQTLIQEQLQFWPLISYFMHEEILNIDNAYLEEKLVFTKLYLILALYFSRWNFTKQTRPNMSAMVCKCLQLFWQSATVHSCLDSLQLVLAVCNCNDCLQLPWLCAAVLTVRSSPNRPWFVLYQPLVKQHTSNTGYSKWMVWY